jgi:uroporphyrin-III C-methyltransferase/precorrin-2 dehydrogenase/sirohydrochlorin ferrochelatase
VAHELVVVSGHVPPDHPQSLVDWPALARLRGTLCVLMGLKNLPAITATLLAHGKPAATPTAVVQEGTTAAQRVVRAPLDAIAERVAEAALRPPAIVVIGDVVDVLPAP